MLTELWVMALPPGCAAPGWRAGCTSGGHEAVQHPLWSAETGEVR